MVLGGGAEGWNLVANSMAYGDWYGVPYLHERGTRFGSFLVSIDYSGTILVLVDWGEVVVYGIDSLKNKFTFPRNSEGKLMIKAETAISQPVRIKVLG